MNSSAAEPLMSEKRSGLLFLPVLTGFMVAWPADPADIKAQEDCAQGSDREQVACLAQKIEIADQELDTVYRT